MAKLTDSQIAAELRAGGFPADQIATGVAIALAESGGRTDALNTANRNGSWDAGLMQINSIHGYSQQALFDVKTNVAAALKIYRAAGNSWRPWSTYNSGSYLRFKARGAIAAGGGGPTLTVVPASSSNDALANASNPGTWARIGMFLLGGVMVLIGLFQMTGVSNTVVQVAGMLPVAKGLRALR